MRVAASTSCVACVSFHLCVLCFCCRTVKYEVKARSRVAALKMDPRSSSPIGVFGDYNPSLVAIHQSPRTGIYRTLSLYTENTNHACTTPHSDERENVYVLQGQAQGRAAAAGRRVRASGRSVDDQRAAHQRLVEEGLKRSHPLRHRRNVALVAWSHAFAARSGRCVNFISTSIFILFLQQSNFTSHSGEKTTTFFRSLLTCPTQRARQAAQWRSKDS